MRFAAELFVNFFNTAHLVWFCRKLWRLSWSSCPCSNSCICYLFMVAMLWTDLTQVTPATGQVRKEQLTALLLPQLCKRKFQLFPIWVFWRLHMHSHNYVWQFPSQLRSSGSRRSVHKSQSRCFTLYHDRHIRMYTGINEWSLEASASAFCIIHLEFFNVLPLAIFLRLVSVYAFTPFRLSFGLQYAKHF